MQRTLMRWRVLTFVSLGVNIALAIAWALTVQRYNSVFRSISSPNSSPSVKTNVVVRRQFFTWSEVESPDYPTYIANLRAIGCPEQTIRDIIIAEINVLYAKRLALELPEQQWWRSEPDPAVVRAAAEKTRELETDRRDMLTRLLGPSWESGDLASLPRPSRPAVKLDGPVLGVLPPEVKQAVEDISVRSQERLDAYLRSAGNNPDPAQVAKLRQQTRDDLARILGPTQLEEYLLRYSQNATELRNQLGEMRYFNASRDEFRSLFRATDPIDQQLQALVGDDSPNALMQRNALLQQRDNAIKLALGPDRYEDYSLLQDPAYRSALVTAQQSGTPEAARTLYQISVATAQQQAAIRANTNLTPEQLAIELKRIELEQLRANAQAVGQELPPSEQTAIPATSTQAYSTTPTIRTHAYVLGVGETIASVAMRYGVTIAQLRAANPDIDLRRLRPGDALQVPDAQR